MYANNLHVPSDVQRVAIPAILAGGNVAVRSYTGSGKTLAFLLPVLSLAIQR
jgi:superfamily II DNA/RNA helicase